MLERYRLQGETGPTGADGLSDRSDQRASAERMLSAANDAIDRALSDDSTEFLRAMRQEGGQ